MPTLPLNAVVGKYRIERRAGAGGMGEVYRATNLQTKAPVAVKALSKTEESGTALARFRNEAVIQYNLRHPSVAELYEYVEYQGIPCIVMEFVEGRTLDEWIRETGALEPGKALEILADICDAVSYMHSKGTIHRDIKSENIRLNAHGKAKLLDFGIAVSRNTPSLTKTGYTIGTPEKMAPEQHQGLRGDPRSDVWALGVLLYEMVTGSPPFANSSPAGLREDITAARCIPAAQRVRRSDAARRAANAPPDEGHRVAADAADETRRGVRGVGASGGAAPLLRATGASGSADGRR